MFAINNLVGEVGLYMRILIADGDREYRLVLKIHLKKLGFSQILESNDGASAFDRLSADEADIVLCDWNLPGVSGLELLGRIRGLEQLAKFPFVMLTSEGTRERVMEALRAGASDCIVKPGTQEILEVKLSRFRKR